MSTLFEDQQHSNYARELCEKMTVGYLPETADTAGQLLDNAYATLSAEEQQTHKDLDKWVDLKKPLLPQIKKMTNKEFLAFVRRPRYTENKDAIILWEDLEFDESKKTYYGQNLKVCLPMVACMLYLAFLQCTSLSDILYSFLIEFLFLGIALTWTFTEYVHHRYEFHREAFLDPEKPADGEWNAL